MLISSCNGFADLLTLMEDTYTEEYSKQAFLMMGASIFTSSEGIRHIFTEKRCTGELLKADLQKGTLLLMMT